MAKIKEKPIGSCATCDNHFGEHNKGWNDQPILCKCKLDEIDHLMNFDYCKNIKLNGK